MIARLLLVSLLTSFSWAQQTPLPDFSVPSGMVRRDFSLGMADLTLVEQLCQETLSPGGKYHVFKTQRKIRVIDKPEHVETIRQMLPHISQAAPNVKIEFTSRTVDNSRLAGGQVRGVIRGGNGRIAVQGQNPGTPGVFERSIGGGDRGDISRQVTPGGVTVFDSGGRGAIEIDLINQTNRGAGLNSQFILVRAGRDGFIETAREIPMIDYFTRFIADGSFGGVLGIDPRLVGNNLLFPLGGGRFEVPEIRWEKAGSRLLVRPTIEGDLIHLEIMPQISAVVIVDPEALRRRGLNDYLTGREQYVTYTKLNTSVTVRNGQSVQIGGFQKATPEFNRFFFGGTQSGGVSSGNFTVRATIQK
tara:strand:- start:7074 stop:8153 length:1080 start_codon:yes stop_codon:yes gene_type:complete